MEETCEFSIFYGIHLNLSEDFPALNFYQLISFEIFLKINLKKVQEPRNFFVMFHLFVEKFPTISFYIKGRKNSGFTRDKIYLLIKS